MVKRLLESATLSLFERRLIWAWRAETPSGKARMLAVLANEASSSESGDVLKANTQCVIDPPMRGH